MNRENMWEQMSERTKAAVAQVLGFNDSGPLDPSKTIGFRLNCQCMSPLTKVAPTIGDFTRAYIAALAKSFETY